MKSLSREWEEFKLKMTQPPFIVPVLIDRVVSGRSMPDTSYNTYGLINSHFIRKNKLQRVPIKERKIFAYDNRLGEEVDAIIKLIINVGGIVRDGFMYEISRMKDQDLILGML